jgi:hypothetical protein
MHSAPNIFQGGIMMSDHEVFMNLGQGDQSVYTYSKLFNHLMQYALEWVETNDKKKACFVRSLSTKYRECLPLNNAGTFPEFLSNAIIVDDAIRDHKERKKNKAMIVPSDNAPHKH